MNRQNKEDGTKPVVKRLPSVGSLPNLEKPPALGGSPNHFRNNGRLSQPQKPAEEYHQLQLSMGSLWIGTLGVLGRMGSPAALIIAAVMATVGGLGMLYEVDEGMLLPLVAFLIIAGILGVLIRGIDASIAVIMSR